MPCSRESIIWLMLQIMMLVSVIGGCSEESAALGQDEIPLPQGAYDVQRFDLSSDFARQTDFRIRVDFLSKEVAEYYISFLGGKGWKSCNSNNEWISFRKRHGEAGSEISVRQFSWYMISESEKKLMAGTLRYLGAEGSSAGQEGQWDEDVQQISLVLYHLPNNEFERTLSTLPIDCDR